MVLKNTYMFAKEPIEKKIIIICKIIFFMGSDLTDFFELYSSHDVRRSNNLLIYGVRKKTQLLFILFKEEKLTPSLLLQLISYKRYLECTLVQWRLSIYP